MGATIEEGKAAAARRTRAVFSSGRSVSSPAVELPAGLALNKRLAMDGLQLLRMLPDRCVTAAFFDPQYRGILDKLRYGNEGIKRGKARCSLSQMTEETIREFIRELDRVLIDNGHLFLWMDKFHLCSGFSHWFCETALMTVDMITWHKGRMGMGYRTRRICEYLVVLQRPPQQAKGVWKAHDIRDVWEERAKAEAGVHPKPVGLQSALIEAVSNPGDLILDPAAGSFSVLKACENTGRNFIGCDLNG
ncbi:MAG: site-specific DNA-methyltransferase [Clostridiales bacterium]|nr:site-specific DNA-methyltransferase [Clostridiales bacterium]